MREILAWTVKCSLLIFTIAGFILMTERLRVSVVIDAKYSRTKEYIHAYTLIVMLFTANRYPYENM